MMEIKFLNEAHEENYKKCLEQDGTEEYDTERKSFFYIISSNHELFKRIEMIYDFDNRSIQLENIIKGTSELSSAEKKMLSIGLSLYNNFKFRYFNFEDYTILELFTGLDKENFKVCIRALRIRFKMYE